MSSLKPVHGYIGILVTLGTLFLCETEQKPTPTSALQKKQNIESERHCYQIDSGTLISRPNQHEDQSYINHETSAFTLQTLDYDSHSEPSLNNVLKYGLSEQQAASFLEASSPEYYQDLIEDPSLIPEVVSSITSAKTDNLTREYLLTLIKALSDGQIRDITLQLLTAANAEHRFTAISLISEINDDKLRISVIETAVKSDLSQHEFNDLVDILQRNTAHLEQTAVTNLLMEKYVISDDPLVKLNILLTLPYTSIVDSLGYHDVTDYLSEKKSDIQLKAVQVLKRWIQQSQHSFSFQQINEIKSLVELTADDSTNSTQLRLISLDVLESIS